MDRAGVEQLRDLLAGNPWIPRAAAFGGAVRHAAERSTPGGLLVVGTPDDEPWHFTAHLRDESELAGMASLAPTLVRWAPPPGAPPHLAVDLRRLEHARRGEALVVVAPDAAPDALLERVDDARGRGAGVLALAGAESPLTDLAHDALVLEPTAPVRFDDAQHLVSLAAGSAPVHLGRRGRLAALLDRVSGRAPD